jgi:hypothetical protein
MKLVFTLCSNNYLAQAITLGDTFLKFNPNYRFIIGLVDKKQDSFDYTKIPYEIIEVEQIGVSFFSEMVLRYDIVELNTSVKPYFFQYFFNTTKSESVIYLDPDIQVFAPFYDLENELGDHDIVIIPHFTTSINDDKWQAEEDFLNSGIYNLGFIAIKNTVNGKKMVNWWAERLRNKAYIDYKRGLFTDQIWINFVPLFFEKVKIFTNVGYNVAYWNLHERFISEKNGNYFVNEKQPLVFYHYASFRPLNPDIISTGQSRFSFKDRPEIAPLFSNYCELLFENGYKGLVKIQCYYLNIKKNHVKNKLIEIKHNTPIYKRVMSKIINIIIRKFGLVLDYETLLSRD